MKYAIDNLNRLLHPSYPTERCDERERDRLRLAAYVGNSVQVVAESDEKAFLGRPLGRQIGLLLKNRPF